MPKTFVVSWLKTKFENAFLHKNFQQTLPFFTINFESHHRKKSASLHPNWTTAPSTLFSSPVLRPARSPPTNQETFVFPTHYNRTNNKIHLEWGREFKCDSLGPGCWQIEGLTSVIPPKAATTVKLKEFSVWRVLF